MYSMGIPVGIFVDTKGPRPSVIVGSFLLALGYFPLRQAYEYGSGSVAALCFFTFCTGFGSCCAFAAAIKTSALNWPHHRGTATAFPLAAFGLSAFFFSIFAQSLFKGSTGDFLLLLAVGTFCMTFVSYFFLRVLPHSDYSAVRNDDTLSRVDSNALHRTKSAERKAQFVRDQQLGESISTFDERETTNLSSDYGPAPGNTEAAQETEISETSSLVSRSSSSCQEDLDGQAAHSHDAHLVDIRGFKMLRHSQFYFLFSLMGLLTGIGLMTIK